MFKESMDEGFDGVEFVWRVDGVIRGLFILKGLLSEERT